tara:strand:+ start:253 stop:438 length:186 start_codon:yes stop_codon:yes gene_type:complete
MKLKIGDQVELNHDFDYQVVIIEGFDFCDEKNVRTAYSKENWFYYNQIRKINKIKVRGSIK